MQYTFIDSIHRIAASQWNALLEDDHPFVRHEFFAALEDSGSTTAQRGWQPHHLLIWQGSQLQAALPLFIKQHSYGEYVFDWGWADAYARHGYDYYPKLLTAIPFTPCRGPRLLGSVDAEQLQGMVQTLQSQARALGASGWHCLFPETTLSERLIPLAAPQRLSCQFHWYNRGYRDFDDFLSTMSSRKRKNILRERRQVAQQGFEFEHKRGEQITRRVWTWFNRPNRPPYLSRVGTVVIWNGGFSTNWDAPFQNTACWCVPVATENPLQARCFCMTRRVFTDATGAVWKSFTTCISKPAITKALTTP